MPFNDEQIASMSPEQRQTAIQAIKSELARRQTMPTAGMSTIPQKGFSVRGAVLGGLKSLVGESPDLTPKEDPTQAMNEFIAKERVKKEIEGDPIEKFRKEQEIKAELETRDPYKQSQLKINNAILKSIEGGQGGDLVYRDQMTGAEVPQEQALMDISQGKQYIINRRITSRQGIKEEPISKPKELTEGEVKTSTGAEEVLTEIDDLKNIIMSEPSESKASIPFFGSSAQAQGVKIPFIAPYGISEKGQEYRTIRESINNRLLYLRSGAQINDKEYQRLSGMLPMLFRSDKVDLNQLDRFRNEFEKILQRIQSGRRGVNTSTKIQDQQKINGQIMIDAQGNKAMVYPDGSFEEIR